MSSNSTISIVSPLSIELSSFLFLFSTSFPCPPTPLSTRNIMMCWGLGVGCKVAIADLAKYPLEFYCISFFLVAKRILIVKTCYFLMFLSQSLTIGAKCCQLKIAHCQPSCILVRRIYGLTFNSTGCKVTSHSPFAHLLLRCALSISSGGSSKIVYFLLSPPCFP